MSAPVLASDRDVVFFDAGFTLLEPVRGLAAVYADAARTCGVVVPEAAMGRAMRDAFTENARRKDAPDLRSSEEIERAAWGAFTQAVATRVPGLPDVHERWLALLLDWFDAPDHWRPTEGAHEVLDALAAAGRRVAIVSNWHGALHQIAERQGLARRVRFVLTSAECGFRKPHPDIFREALRRFDARPEQAVHVGDSAHDDVGGALAAGVLPVHLAAAGAPIPTPTPDAARRIERLADLI